MDRGGNTTWEEGEVCLVDLSTPAFIVVFRGRADEATLTNRNQPQVKKKVMGNFQLDRDSSLLLWIEVRFPSCNRCHKGLRFECLIRLLFQLSLSKGRIRLFMSRSCPVVQYTIIRPVAYTGSPVSSTVSFSYRYTLSRQTI